MWIKFSFSVIIYSANKYIYASVNGYVGTLFCDLDVILINEYTGITNRILYFNVHTVYVI